MGLVIFLAAIVILTLLFALYSYKICFHSSKKRVFDDVENWFPKGKQYEAVKEQMLASVQRMLDAPCEWINIRSHDKRKLWARYYENRPGAPLMLVFHGYRGFCHRDCAAGFALANKLGFNVLAVDQRSHGRSEGRVITFGIRERHDCIDWIHFVCKRFGSDTPIILSGVSMGAATVLMATELELGKNVVCVMADCPYTSPASIICKVSNDIGYPQWISYPFIRLGAFLYGGFHLTECSALESVKNTAVPILLVHGEDDRFVPCSMSRQIYENCKNAAQLHTFPLAGHGLSYLVDPNRYEKICVDFLWSINSLQPHLSQCKYAADLHSA